MIPIDEKRYLLISIAKGYMSSGRYEIDELVNESWLSKHVRESQEPSLLWMAGNWAMINYMRKQEERNRKRWKIHISSLYDDEGGYVYEPEAMPLQKAEVREELERMHRGLSPRQLKIMQWKFEGRQLKYIGEQLGVSKDRGRQLWRQVQAMMRIRYEISCAEAS